MPPPVLAAHVLVAGGGLILWIAYLISDAGNLIWYSLIALVLAAALGLTMAIRWLSVYRAQRMATRYLASPAAGRAQGQPGAGPPERNFPLPVVVTHGVFAVTTLTLVLLTLQAGSLPGRPLAGPQPRSG